MTAFDNKNLDRKTIILAIIIVVVVAAVCELARWGYLKVAPPTPAKAQESAMLWEQRP